MPHWLIKSAIHRAISWMPRSHYWNELFQKRFTKSVETHPAHFEVKLNQCRIHFECLSQFGSSIAGFKVVELGTGYYPFIPIGLYLCGSSEAWTYDIAPLVTRQRVARALQLFLDYEGAGRLKQLLPAMIPERFQAVREALPLASTTEPARLLDRFNIHYLNRDAAKTGLADASIDFIFSTGVLDYIPPAVLLGLFREFRRISTPNAVMSHHFGLLDQSADFDKSITRLNFLQFSPRMWKFLASPLIWQNRLRIPDYRKLLAEAGFKIVSEENTLASEDELKGVRLAPEFKGYTKEELLVGTTWLVSKPAGPDGR